MTLLVPLVVEDTTRDVVAVDAERRVWLSPAPGWWTPSDLQVEPDSPFLHGVNFDEVFPDARTRAAA